MIDTNSVDRNSACNALLSCEVSVVRLFIGVLLMSAIGCNSVPPEPKGIARVPYSDGHCILRDDFMVVIECSGGRDMLPVSLVSQELVDAFEAQMKANDSLR